MIVIYSFVEYRDIIEKIHSKSAITSNISDITKLINDKRLKIHL